MHHHLWAKADYWQGRIIYRFPEQRTPRQVRPELEEQDFYRAVIRVLS